MNQTGNVLFIILIAIVLFAALSYAVTHSSRSGGGNISKEAASAAAADFLQYMAQGRQAIERMRVINGCADTDISFEIPGIPYDYTHTPPAREACKLFSQQQGRAMPRENPAWLEPDYVGSYAYYVTGALSVSQTGTSAPELLLFYTGLKKEVCEAINQSLGISGTPGWTSVANTSPITEFRGVYGAPSTYQDTIHDAFRGRPYGCYRDPGGYYGYYDVLIAR